MIASEVTWKDKGLVRPRGGQVGKSPLRLEAMPANPNRVAVMFGPLVMAGEP